MRQRLEGEAELTSYLREAVRCECCYRLIKFIEKCFLYCHLSLKGILTELHPIKQNKGRINKVFHYHSSPKAKGRWHCCRCVFECLCLCSANCCLESTSFNMIATAKKSKKTQILVIGQSILQSLSHLVW